MPWQSNQEADHHNLRNTVDYFIASRSLSNFTQSMKVHDFNFLSDHCMLTAKFLLGSNLCHDENICLVDTLERLAPDRFVWSERSKIKFQDVFSSPSIQETRGPLVTTRLPE